METLEAAAKNLGLTVEWTEEVSRAAQIEGLQNDRYDIIGSAVWANPERAKLATLSNPLYYSPFYIYARKDDAKFNENTLAHSGKTRGAFAKSEEQPQLDRGHRCGAAPDFGGTARRWRFDRMGTVVTVGTGRVLASFAAVAQHYGVGLDICPPRRGNRKGCVEESDSTSAPSAGGGPRW